MFLWMIRLLSLILILVFWWYFWFWFWIRILIPIIAFSFLLLIFVLTSNFLWISDFLFRFLILICFFLSFEYDMVLFSSKILIWINNSDFFYLVSSFWLSSYFWFGLWFRYPISYFDFCIKRIEFQHNLFWILAEQIFQPNRKLHQTSTFFQPGISSNGCFPTIRHFAPCP